MYHKTEQEIMQNWKGDHGTPVVSICCITYNHESYIAEAIDGFLIQETDFPFEILINDDCSTDETASIIRNYEKKYPNIIKPIYQEENQYSKGVNINVTFNYPRAKGEYIALCEGDDYWTDNLKLQKQVGLLENHQSISSCAHQSMVKYNINIIDHELKKDVLEQLNLDDIIHYHMFQTATFIFRSKIVIQNTLPNDILSGDKALFFLCTAYGKIHYYSECMSVYRKHEGGISTWVTPKMLIKDLNIIPWILPIIPDFPKNKFRAYTYEAIIRIKQHDNVFSLYKYYILYAYFSFSFFPKNVRMIFGFTKLLISKSIQLLYFKSSRNA